MQRVRNVEQLSCATQARLSSGTVRERKKKCGMKRKETVVALKGASASDTDRGAGA